MFGYEHNRIIDYIEKYRNFVIFFIFRLNSPQPLRVLSGELAISSFQSKSMSVLGCFSELIDRKTFADIAEKFRDIFYFGLLSKDLSDSLCKTPNVRITDASGYKEVIDWDFAKINFTSLLLTRSLPMVTNYSHLDNALLHHYSLNLPLCVFFYLFPEDRDILNERISQITYKYRHRTSFVLANWMEAESLAREFKIGDPVSCALPTLSVGYVQKDTFFLFPGCGLANLKPDSISEFLDAIFENRIEPYGQSKDSLYDSESNDYEDDIDDEDDYYNFEVFRKKEAANIAML